LEGSDFAMLHTLKTTRKTGDLQFLRSCACGAGFTPDSLTLKKRITNIEVRYSIIIINKD
jgi:hypothetical protein